MIEDEEEIARHVLGMGNRMIVELNQLPGHKRGAAAIAIIMQLAEQVFTYVEDPHRAFLVLTTFLTSAYDETQSSKGKDIQ